MALTDNLTFYLKGYESSGNALDAHSSFEFTANNGPGSTAGKISLARDFDNTAFQYFSHADHTDLSAGSDFSGQAWVKLDSKGTGQRVGIGKLGTPNREWVTIYSGFWDRFAFYVYSDGDAGVNLVLADNFGSPSTGVWYLLQWRHDSVADEIAIAVNGVKNTVAHTTGVFDGTAAFEIGRNPEAAGNADFYHDGAICEIAFWKRTVSDAEWTTMYNGGDGLAYPFGTGHPTIKRLGGFTHVRPWQSKIRVF